MNTFALHITKRPSVKPVVQKKGKGKVLQKAAPAVAMVQAKRNSDFQWLKDNEIVKSRVNTIQTQPSRQNIVQPKMALQAGKNANKPPVIQTKLEIGTPGDRFEREADYIADRVVSMPQGEVFSPVVKSENASSIQRYVKNKSPAPLAINSLLNHSPPVSKTNSSFTHIQLQESSPIRAGPLHNATLTDIEGRLNSTSGRGSPMSPQVRNFFETRMDADFGNVRIHTGSESAKLNNRIGSYAFTYQNNIYFNHNQYNPGSTAGNRLIAHELTHVIQQGAALKRKSLSISNTGPVIQAFGMQDVREFLNELCRNIPGYTLVTVLIGYNFILGQSVERNAVNLFDGFLGLLGPIGNAISLLLQRSGILSRAATWLNNQLARLNISRQALTDAYNRAVDTLDWTDIFNWRAAVRRTLSYFTPFFERAANFASQVFDQVVAFLRETVLSPLADFAQTLPGYSLLCVIMGRNPITRQVVPRSAENFVRGFMGLIPGGEEKWQQIQQSGAITRIFNWLNDQVTTRNLTWARISGTFTEAWDSLSATDILHPIDTIRRIAGIFRPLLSDILGFALAALEKILEFIFEAAMGAGGNRVLAIIRRARATFNTIIRNPVGFLTNLVNAVKQGIRQFSANILTHLRNGLVEWLVGGLTRAGLQLPEQWDLRGILSFVLQILGLTYPRIREKMVRLMGERPVQIIEEGFELVRLLITQGPMAVWERILEHMRNFRDMVFNGIREWIQQRIVIAAITRLATMFNPIGAVIQAILGIYNTIMFFVERINQILTLVEAVVDSISAIAAGSIGAAANYVEQSMARAIPVILSFLARLIGIGDIATPIRRVVEAIQARVDQAIDRVIEWIRNAARSLVSMGRSAVAAVVNWWRTDKRFRNRSNHEHRVFFTGEGRNTRIMIASDNPVEIQNYLEDRRNSGTDISAAQAKYNETRAVMRQFETQPNPEADRQTIVNKLNELSDAFANLSDAPNPSSYPNPEWVPGRDNTSPNKPSTVTVDKLSSGKKPTGSPPQNTTATSGVTGWRRIAERGLTRVSDRWVQMHLINERLGGQGHPYNLVPGPNSVNSGSMRSFEDTTIRLLNNPQNMIWIQVTVQYRSGNNSDYASNVRHETGLYLYTNNQWIKDSQAQISNSSSVPVPVFSEGDLPSLSAPSETRLSSVLNAGNARVFSAVTVDRMKDVVAAEGGFGTLNSFKSRMLAYPFPLTPDGLARWRANFQSTFGDIDQAYADGKFRIR